MPKRFFPKLSLRSVLEWMLRRPVVIVLVISAATIPIPTAKKVLEKNALAWRSAHLNSDFVNISKLWGNILDKRP